MFYFVISEVVLIVICIFVAKKMVDKRSRLLDHFGMVIGKEDNQTIEAMENMVKAIIFTGKFQISEELEGYKVSVKSIGNCIEEVVIKSRATKISYNSNRGWQRENYGYTEKGAIAQIAFVLWVGVSITLFILGLCALALWIHLKMS